MQIARPRLVRPAMPRGFRLLWLAAILVPLLAILGAGAMSWSDVQREAEARLGRTADMLTQHALRAFVTQDTILAALAGRLRGMGPEEISGSEEVHLFLRSLSEAAQPLVSGILVTDPEDFTLAASFEYPARRADLRDRDYLQVLRGGTEVAIGQVVESRPMGWHVFPVARRRAEGGAVVSSFSPEAFSRFYESVTETPQDLVALFRADGAVLARHPLVPLDAMEEKRAELGRLLDRLRAGEAVRMPSPLDGVERLYVGRQVPGWPVVVTYGLSQKALRADWMRRMIAPVAGGLAAMVLLLLLTGIASRGTRRQQEAAESRMEAEAQLARAGRAAAIGLLAAGLAHDVKNLVQAVRSGARLMDRKAEEPEEVRRCAALLGDAAERGGRLVDSMLGFARGRAEEGGAPVLDVAAALRDLVPLLDRTLGSAWRVHLVLPPGLPPARGDRSGFEAAVVNLAANARDAMPAGGIVTIAAWVERLTEGVEEEGLAAGRYVVAGITDAGAGMDPDTLARVGEPFFTTKPPGRGTGLGLATVRGFAARSGGALRLESALGQGTTAAIWLPVA